MFWFVFSSFPEKINMFRDIFEPFFNLRNLCSGPWSFFEWHFLFYFKSFFRVLIIQVTRDIYIFASQMENICNTRKWHSEHGKSKPNIFITITYNNTMGNSNHCRHFLRLVCFYSCSYKVLLLRVGRSLYNTH